MSDKKKSKRTRDPLRINIHEAHEVRYWTERFGCTAQRLQEAVSTAGVSVRNVEAYMRKFKKELLKDVTTRKPVPPLNVTKVRAHYPMLKVQAGGKKLVYLDCAATAHKPRSVIRKLQDYYSNEYAKPNAEHTFSRSSTLALAAARTTVAEFLGAESAKSIVFTRNSTESLNMVAHGFAGSILTERDEIIITQMEHHSNIIPWQMAAVSSNATIRVAPVTPSGELDLKALAKLINAKTRVIAMPHVSHVLGTVLPVKEVARMAHARNIALVVDGAQAAPHIPVNVKELGCDFYALSGHKLGAPTGTGVLYGKQQWLKKIGPMLGGGNMVTKVTYGSCEFAPIPAKFEAGTPAFAEILALATAVQHLHGLNMEKTSEYERQLLAYASTKLRALPGIRIYGNAPAKQNIISFDVKGRSVKRLEKFLSDEYGIAVRAGDLTAQPLMEVLGVKQLLRASFSYCNTFEEVDLFVKAVARFVKGRLSYGGPVRAKLNRATIG